MKKLQFKLIFHLYDFETNDETIKIFTKLMDRVLEPSTEYNCNGYRGEKLITLKFGPTFATNNEIIKSRLNLEFQEYYRKKFNIKKGKYNHFSKFMVFDPEKQKYIFVKDIKELLK
nr:MAG TPA: hypothetical protein [Caudoviricetes sp.]